jgi:ADP-ribosyltransferase-like protein
VTDLFQEQTADDPFALVADVPVAAPTVSPEYNEKRTRVAALAQTDPQKPDILGQMSVLLDQTNTVIQQTGDESIRRQVAAKQRVDKINAFTGLLRDQQLREVDPTIALGAATAAQNQIMADDEQQAKYAMEQEAVNRIQDLAADGDTAQARMLLNNFQFGDANRVIRDTNTKALILERELEKIKGTTEGDWIGSASHFLLSLTGIYNSVGDDVNVKGGLGEWYDWMFSGRRKQIQSNSLWNMPVEDFSDFVQNKLIPDIQKNANFLGFQDKHKELSTLAKLQKPSSVLGQNLEDGLNNLGWIGPAELSKTVSIPGLLVRNGARKEATQLLMQAAIEIQTDGAEAALKKTGVSADELIDNALPHAVNPAAQTYEVGGKFISKFDLENGFDAPQTFEIVEHLGSPGTADELFKATKVGDDFATTFAPEDFEDYYKYIPPQTEGVSSVVSMQTDINDLIDRTQDLMSEFRNLNQLGRLTAAETQDAIDAAITRLTKDHGAEFTKDIAVKTINLSDGTSFKRVEFTLGTFNTPDEAIKYAREVGLGEGVQLEGFASNADRAIRVVPGLPVVKQPGFMDWFKGSKITATNTADGAPLKLYHGAKTHFEAKFDPEKSQYYGGQMFFATDPKTTKSFNYAHFDVEHEKTAGGHTIPVYIKADNPFDPLHNSEHQKKWVDWLKNTPTGQKVLSSSGYGPSALSIPDHEVVKGYWGAMEKMDSVDWIKSQGHGGFWIWSETEGRNLVIWDPEKIVNAIEPSDLNGKVIRDESGQYSVRVQKDVAETGFHTEVLKPQASGMLSRLLLSARAIGDRLLANQAQSAGNTRNKLLKTFVKNYGKKFATLSNTERNDLSQVLAVGENRGEWYSRDQLEALYNRAYKRPPSTKEFEAYAAAQNVNDIEFLLRNDELYKQKVVTGHETVSYETGAGTADRVNAKVITDWSTIDTDRVFNLTDNVSYSNTSNPLLESQRQSYREQGYVLVKLDAATEMADGTTVNALLAKRSDLKIEPLRRDQIKYRAGGHRIYRDNYFAKQARIGVQPDGEKFMKNPSTFIVGSRAQVDLWTSQMEEARRAFLAGADPSEIGKYTPPYMTGEQFTAGMLDGTYDPDQAFRTMFDRETMPEYVNTPGYADLRNTDQSDIEQFLHTNGKMYYSHKGDVLPDYQGNMAPTLDPYMTINRALHNVANLASFSDYKLSAAERWNKTFGGHLNQRALSPMQAIREGTFGLNTSDAIKQSAEAQRDVIKRALGWKTEFDHQQEIYTRRFAEWVAGDDPYSLRNKATTAVSNWFDTNHPVQALRGLAFDLKLGLFNVAQFPLQLGTLAAATTISPKYGFYGMVHLFPLKAYMTKSGSEDMLQLLVDRGLDRSAGFSSADEFKEYMRFTKKSGFFDLGSTHQLINDGGPNSVVGAFKKTDNIREGLRFWFYEGEWWNRAIASRIAWGETREKFPQLATDSNEFLLEVTGRAEEFAFSMSDQSAAAWQKGITSIPTQFWAYNARMLEAMMGKTFTPAQKARLILGQTLLYGAAGIPVAPFIVEQINKAQGKNPDVDSPAGFVTRGMLDQAVFQITGQDLLVSKRFGTGSFVTDTLKDIFGMSSYGEKSAGELLGGASYNIAFDGFETILDVIKYAAHESGGVDSERPITREALLRLASNASTFSNLHKAYMVHKYGELLSNKGTVIAANVPSQSAFAIALSVQPAEVEDVTSAMQYLNNEKEAVDEAVKFIHNHRMRMINEPANNQDLSEEIQAYVNLLPPEIRVQALRKAQSRLQPSLLEGLTMQVERDRIRAEALRNMEGNDGSDTNP